MNRKVKIARGRKIPCKVSGGGGGGGAVVLACVRACMSTDRRSPGRNGTAIRTLRFAQRQGAAAFLSRNLLSRVIIYLFDSFIFI